MADVGEYGRPQRMRGESKWADVARPTIEHEDRMTEEEAEEVWNKIYSLFRANGESARNEVKLAVYAYYAANGASPQTPHTKDIVTGGGASVLSADVLDAIGGRDLIRRFLRANVDEAYSALKESGTMASDEVFVSKASDKGVPRQYAYCAVDFLRGCSLFTPVEKDFAGKAFAYSIVRARNARGGKSVEDISRAVRGEQLEAQVSGAPGLRSHDDDF